MEEATRWSQARRGDDGRHGPRYWSGIHEKAAVNVAGCIQGDLERISCGVGSQSATHRVLMHETTTPYHQLQAENKELLVASQVPWLTMESEYILSGDATVRLDLAGERGRPSRFQPKNAGDIITAKPVPLLQQRNQTDQKARQASQPTGPGNWRCPRLRHHRRLEPPRPSMRLEDLRKAESSSSSYVGAQPTQG